MGSQQRFERTAFENEDLGIPWLKSLGRSRQRAARPGLEPHAQPDTYEICLLQSGRVDWWVEDKLFSVGAGEIFFTRPQERHGSQHAVVQPCELYWLEASFEGTRPPGVSAQICADMQREFEHSLPRVFSATAEIQSAFKCLLDECCVRQPWWQERAATLLWGLLIDLVRAGNLHGKTVHVISPEIIQALDWMRAHLVDKYSLAYLASRLGYSAPHFQAKFVREMGIPPGQFRTQLRLEEAKRMIVERASLTSIAYDVGFSSSQYFATTFRRMVGLTPSEYRRRMGS